MKPVCEARNLLLETVAALLHKARKMKGGRFTLTDDDRLANWLR